MAKKPTSKLSVETLKHDEAKRKNIPTAEYQSVMRKDTADDITKAVAWARKTKIRGTVRILAYPKFRLTQDEIQILFGSYLPCAETVNTASIKTIRLPLCRDPHDQKFLILAQAGKANTFITGDRALLALAGQTRFQIETPAEFRRRHNL